MKRWISRDPIGEMGGLNLYGFVGNDGVNAWDLLGLFILIGPPPPSVIESIIGTKPPTEKELENAKKFLELATALQNARNACRPCCPDLADKINSRLSDIVPRNRRLRRILNELKSEIDALHGAVEGFDHLSSAANFLQESLGVGVNSQLLSDLSSARAFELEMGLFGESLGEASKIVGLASAASSGDYMIFALKVGETYAPPVVRNYMGFYSEAYTASVRAIGNFKYQGGAADDLKTVAQACRSDDCYEAEVEYRAVRYLRNRIMD